MASVSNKCDNNDLYEIIITMIMILTIVISLIVRTMIVGTTTIIIIFMTR